MTTTTARLYSPDDVCPPEKLRGEHEYLQAAFESYKSQLQQELEEQWLKQDEEQKQKTSDDLREAILQTSE